MELAKQDPVNFKSGRKGDLVSVSFFLRSQSEKKEAKPHIISASHAHHWEKLGVERGVFPSN